MSAYRFLPGILLVQLATTALVFAAGSSSGAANWPLVAMASLLIALVVSYWFAAIAEHGKKDALAEIKERFVQERERLLMAAEAEKRTLVEDSHRKLVQETNRAYAKANFKLGVAVAAMMGIASVLLYLQWFTLALVAFATLGGALTGYVTRGRQNALEHRRRGAEAALLPASHTVAHVEEQPTRATFGRGRRNR